MGVITCVLSAGLPKHDPPLALLAFYLENICETWYVSLLGGTPPPIGAFSTNKGTNVPTQPIPLL